MGFFSALFGKSDNSELVNAIKEGAFLVDVRTSSEFSLGSVKGAANIPLESLSSQLAKFKNKKTIVVFCRSGGRSSQAKCLLEQNNFKNVVNGGTWQNVKEVINV